MFGYAVERMVLAGSETKGIVTFTHPDYIELNFEDVYALGPEQLKAMRIVLESGHRLAGTVLDAEGRPVARAIVKLVSEDGGQRKAILTNEEGKFSFRGLKDGLTTLTARNFAIKQKTEREIDVDTDKDDLEVRLQTIATPADLRGEPVLGMTLADVTPELKAAYDLFNDKGAIIIDPGKDFERLKIGELAEGYVFWMVGDTRVGSVHEFVDQILAQTAGPKAETYSVRVVYSFSTVEFDGSNTQFMKLTDDDLAELRKLADRLKAKAR